MFSTCGIGALTNSKIKNQRSKTKKTGFMKTLTRLLNLRLWSLFVKEFHQIRRNRRLVILLIIPPTLNIILFGLALNPTFEDLRLGVVDDSRTQESRELQSAFTEGLVFRTQAYYASTEELGR